MKFFFLLLVIQICNVSQAQNNDKSYSVDSKYLKTFSSFWKYWNTELNLSEAYVPTDSLLNPLTKSEFLSAIASGRYIPTKSMSNKTVYYSLKYIGSEVDQDIINTLKSMGDLHLKYYLMEGKKFSNYNFIDINGNVYNDSTTNGKVIALKTFFINCQKCNEEIPQLNGLVEKYRKKDIVFITLALDTETELKNFLINKSFKYSVIADQTNFITKELKLNTYPTHLIINQQKEIVKVLNDSKYIEPVLKKLLLH